MVHKLILENDPDAENPSDCGGWKVISFSNRHVDHENPDNYISGVDPYGDVIPANVGIRRKLDTGTAFILSCYQHSGTAWSLKGEGMQDRWDTARIAGIIIWQDKPKYLPKTYEERQKSVRSFLEEYNSWCNGDCHYARLEDGEGNDVDNRSCIGSDYFMETVNEMLTENNVKEVEVEGEGKWLLDFHDLKAKVVEPANDD